MADRVVVMNQGRVEQAADPITLYEKPRNLFVAAFIGAPSMNFIKGRLGTTDKGRAFLTDDGVSIALSQSQADILGGNIGQALTLGIRPEHTAEDRTEYPRIDLKIHDIEPLGPHTLAIGHVGNTNFTAQLPAHARIKPDDVVSVPLDPTKIHFFSTDTGEAVGR